VHTVKPAAHRLGIKIYKEDSEYYFDETGQRIIYDDDGMIKDPLVIKEGKVISGKKPK